MIKNAIRWLLWPIAVLTGGEYVAYPGRIKFRILNWLYGDDAEAVAPEFDVIWPDKEGQ